MNLQQFKIIIEAERNNFNLTQVARALFTSQSGISKAIKELEEELGFEIFSRQGKRLKGLTEPGKSVFEYAFRILENVRNIKEVKGQFSSKDSGQLILATTHTQARYSLPELIMSFRNSYPNVQFVLHQASPPEISSMLDSGEADLAIATESLQKDVRFATFPFYHWFHGVVVPTDHPLSKKNDFTLKNLSEYPIITYHKGFTGRSKIDDTFTKNKIRANVVLEALDADVIKAYVALNLGVGIIASMAYDNELDTNLTLLDGSEIFPPNTTVLAFRKDRVLKGFAAKFASLCLKNMAIDKIQKATLSEKFKN
jgi:LysR family cys regulon transcriptional activator